MGTPYEHKDTARIGNEDEVQSSHNTEHSNIKHVMFLFFFWSHILIHLILEFKYIQMAQAIAFQAALQRMGFSQAAVAAMTVNGITTSQDLIGLDDKDVEQILKIIRIGPPPILVPYIAQKGLNIMCYWASRRHRLNEPIDAVLFNAAAIETYGKMMTFESKEEDTIVKPPAEFKAGTKWKAFKEGTIAYLNSIKGMHNIPLAYIIRENAAPPPNQAYQSEHHRLIAITPLQGIEFEEDNGKVFDLLKSWTINSPAWTWMRASNVLRDGRQVWLSEGEAQRDRVKDNAYAAIASARYYGERKKFTFETYVTIHQSIIFISRHRFAFF